MNNTDTKNPDAQRQAAIEFAEGLKRMAASGFQMQACDLHTIALLDALASIQPESAPDEIKRAISKTLRYFDEEFPLDKFPDREESAVSLHAGGITVGQLRGLLDAKPPEQG